MSYYDMNNEEHRLAHGWLIVGLLGCFWIGAFVGVYFGVSPFWAPSPGGLSRFWFAFWVSAPLGFFGCIPYMALRGILDHRKTQAAAASMAPTSATAASQEVAQQDLAPKPPEGFKGLKFGVSSGHLYGFEHVGGLPPGTPVFAAKEDCAKNILILGGIGSGKTTRAINPILKQLFEQQCGALVFDIKGDFSREVDFIARQTGRSYIKVGVDGLTLNLIRGTTPELAASYLKSCFIASGSAGGNAAFFVDQAVELCRQCLTLLTLTGGDYSLAGLYDMVFADAKREAALDAMVNNGANYDLRQGRLAESVSNYFDNIHSKFDEKMLSSVNSTVAQVLSPFSHPDLVDAFSGGETEGEADLTALLDGAIYFVNLPMTKFGKEGSRYAYMLVKLRFMSLMRERRTRADWNQKTPVAFVCDEYQAIIDSITDSDFWDKSRSAGCLGVVSMQGMSSLYHSVGSRQAADAIVQNFRQRIIFRTEDEPTMQMAQRLLGQIDVLMVSTSEGSNTSISTSQSMGASASSSKSESGGSSYNESASIQRQQVFDANDFRGLATDYALFVGNVGDRAVDEVIQMQPLFVTDDAPVAAQATHATA